jgi:hypothetical protein
VVLEVALEYTDLSSRLLAAWITDSKDFAVSESTVYQLLRCPSLYVRADHLERAINV